MILEYCRSNIVSLLPLQIRLKMSLFNNSVELLNAILLPVVLAIIKFPTYSKLEFLKDKGIHLADTSSMTVGLKRVKSSQTSVMVQR